MDENERKAWADLARSTAPLVTIRGQYPNADIGPGVWNEKPPNPARFGYRLPSHEAGARLLAALAGIRRGSDDDYLLDDEHVATGAEVKEGLRTWLGLIQVTEMVPQQFPTLVGAMLNLQALASDPSVGATRYFASLVKSVRIDPSLSAWAESLRAKRRAAAAAEPVARSERPRVQESVERRIYGAHLTVLRWSDETENLAGQTVPVTDAVDYMLSDEVVYDIEDMEAETPLGVPWKNRRGAHAVTDAVVSAYGAKRQRITDADTGTTRRRLALTVGADWTERNKQHRVLLDELIDRISPAVQREFRLAEADVTSITQVVQIQRTKLEEEMAR